MENIERKNVVKALAVAFVANILENYSSELTEDEITHAQKVAYAACEDMEKDGVQSTAYELFLQTVKMLEE